MGKRGLPVVYKDISVSASISVLGIPELIDFWQLTGSINCNLGQSILSDYLNLLV